MVPGAAPHTAPLHPPAPPPQGGGAAGGSFTSGHHGMATTYEGLKNAEEFAFVVTDVESSTELSQQDPEAFKQVGGGRRPGNSTLMSRTATSQPELD